MQTGCFLRAVLNRREWRYGFAGVAVAGAVLVTGCRRNSIPEPPAVPEAAVPAPPVPSPVTISVQPEMPTLPVPVDAVVTPPLPPPAVEAGETVRVLSDEEAEISVRAITGEGDLGIRVGVVKKGTGGSALLSMGQEFDGYKLVGYDAASDRVIFLKNDERVGISLSAANTSGPEAITGPGGTSEAGEVPMGAPPDRIDLSDIEQSNFKPTEAEREQGIDPNDAGTWPEGYRGPVIERLLQKQREAGIEPEAPPAGIFPVGP